jgi:ethanolamine utilization cobalamin adenosyltransferase
VPIVTESDLREQLGTPRRGAILRVPAGTRLTPAAEDLVRAWDLQLVPQAVAPQAAAPQAVSPQEAAPQAAAPQAVSPQAGVDGARSGAPWDRPGRFPVVLDGELPTCATCGTAVRDKPSHLTQLDAHHFAPKTDPRIRLRGRLDTLHALTLVVQARSRADGWEETAEQLGTVAAFVRELLAAEYQGRPPGAIALAGLDEETIHHASHHPEEAVGLPHLVPDDTHPELLHWLNLLRCQVREAEVLVLDAYPPGSSGDVGAGLSRGVNRLSSAVYVLELQVAAAAAGGQP